MYQHNGKPEDRRFKSCPRNYTTCHRFGANPKISPRINEYGTLSTTPSILAFGLAPDDERMVIVARPDVAVGSASFEGWEADALLGGFGHERGRCVSTVGL